MLLPYRVLYYFESPTASLLEIKRLDLPGEQEPGRLYHWLWFDKATATIQPLEFVSMQAGEAIQQREFRQGQLAFTAEAATYVPHAGGQAEQLAAVSSDALPTDLPQALSAFLATE